MIGLVGFTSRVCTTRKGKEEGSIVSLSDEVVIKQCCVLQSSNAKISIS